MHVLTADFTEVATSDSYVALSIGWVMGRKQCEHRLALRGTQNSLNGRGYEKGVATARDAP